MANRPPYPGMPRWVKAFGIIVIVLVVLFVVMVFIGGHGPGRHAASGDHGGNVPPSGVLDDRTPREVGRG